MQEGQVKITVYTDPLCCWSWAFDQPWKQLLSHYGEKIEYRYVMCGMIPDWEHYNDPMNSVSRPMQMGPVWMHASQVTGTKMDYSIWHKDPPSSSYPPCLAVKTAALQSPECEEIFLDAVREVLMHEGKNISRPQVLMEVARNIKYDGFDGEKFKHDWLQGKGKPLLKADLEKAKIHNVTRHPTLTFENTSGKGFMIVGYRPYDALSIAFEKIIARQKPIGGND